MIVEEFSELLELYIENTQRISEFRVDVNRTRYHMCGIEGQTVNVVGHNINTREEFEFRFVVSNVHIWYTNHCIEQLKVTANG
ncbi:hypothetical protein NVP1244A_090 [Vibrio phage 1.244.A._10N.261.54.C3]|nr:hypothetical protein NVP1244A_090 [Vibrio phage 1.244.A._10N.261.54.C3]AUR98718.1 hypothetical protein NVP1255O_090 [Vibrio phage 1.255.O._10N.286.45.F1]